MTYMNENYINTATLHAPSWYELAGKWNEEKVIVINYLEFNYLNVSY
jgi:hypothetical protein